MAFFRAAFDVRTAVRSLALTIESASDDLRRRVPAALMERIHKIIADDPAPEAASSALSASEMDAFGVGSADEELIEADVERVRKARTRCL